MTKPDGLAPDSKHDVSPAAAWGTWEELLLAFAVNRHGTGAWDSIANELRKRTSDSNLALTAQNCRLKYIDLKRRFVAANGDLDDEDAAGRDDKSNVEESVPLLEELRKLRVAELRREVQRYDLNIESLESKVKRMEDERERSSKRENSETDLKKESEEKTDAEPKVQADSGREPAAAGGGDESEKDQLSVNESNSTDPDGEKARASEKESEPVRTGGEEVRQERIEEEPAESKPEIDQKSIRADSCNGSSNSIQEPDRKVKAGPVAESAGLVESEAESDGVRAEATKENSDVQSSASRSKKEEGIDKVRRGSTSGDERDHEDQSRAVKELSAESQPLVDLLQAIRAHKLGSTFERRLRSQESSKYQKLILQHVDLETIETRLKEGWYSGSSSSTKFYRDLLLLVNNALVFFSKNSGEANAATEVRRVIMKEMSHKKAKSDSSSGKKNSLQSMLKKAEPDPPSNSLMLKPRISGSLIVCRKRSSIAAKASASSSGTDKKKEPAEEKDTRSQLSGDAEEPKITKKRTRDRFPAAAAPPATKKNSKNQSGSGGKNSVESTKQQGKGGSSSQVSEPKDDSNKKSQSTSDSKKRGAANFLSRMKQGSSSNNGVLLDALKKMPLNSENSSGGKGGGSETKKNDTGKRGGEKKEAPSKKVTETRQSKEKVSPAKRNVGRPPKRGAAPPPPPPSLGKRGRERVEADTPPPSKQPKKRSRKL